MTPLAFEERYCSEWRELADMLQRARGEKKVANAGQAEFSAQRLTQLYRRACEQLALARSRSFPAHLVDRLESLTHDAHQLIYRQRDFGLSALAHLLLTRFPQAVREHANYVWVAALVFILPTLILGWLVYRQPELILAVVSADTAAQFETMYSPTAEALGRLRGAETDVAMFGFYIRNNMTVALQCFASGLAAGVGSLLYLAFNGGYGGAIGGYLTNRGMGGAFYPFIATHSAFELTAIVLSGAAGLRIGHAWLMPRRRSRRQSLVDATRDVLPVVYGVLALLLIAAAIEAFWSSASALPASIKYAAAALCWTAVLAWLTLQGRDRAS
ncbi:MAG: stage II sporulation protein M [Pseudomonadales bacterium]|nr:stage II sporulation protein M [Pseudomonadales bacterium]